MSVANRYQSELGDLKKKVKESYDYFKPNFDLYNEMRRFVFKTATNDNDRQVLRALNKPDIEFNISEAFLSRQLGEFAKQIPSIQVSAQDGATVDPKTIEYVEGHIRYLLNEANKQGTEYNSYLDSLSGGFSVLKVWTEYAHPMSFNQVMRFGRAFEPSLCGFDPIAQMRSKCDGDYCFELHPMSKEDFVTEHPDIDIANISFSRNVESFRWSYSNSRKDILLVCDFYKKKKKRVKIVQLVTGHVMEMEDYKKFLEHWKEKGLMQQPPAIMGEPRYTETEVICRYVFIENQMLSYEETDYCYLPLVFVDGHSILLQEPSSGTYQQVTRPYVYQAKGLQKLINLAGQTLGNQIEMLVQHKFKVAKESLPNEKPYLDAYSNVQLANVLVYNAFKEDDPSIPVPPPQEITMVPAPPEVMGTFQLAGQMMQMILGSYDASLGVNENQLSGVAIVEGATQSNAAAMPYLVSYMEALNQVATIIVDLIPKYYVNPRNLPMATANGKNTYAPINQPNGTKLDYGQFDLKVKVEAGVNFAIQKNRALNQLIALMQASPVFAQFMNQEGLEVLLDNIEIRGIDQIKAMAAQFMQQTKQQQAQQAQMAQQQAQMNPMMIKAQTEQMRLQQEDKQNQASNLLESAKISNDKQSIDNETLKIIQQMRADGIKGAAAMQKADAERSRSAVDLAIKAADMSHSHALDTYELAHKVSQTVNQPSEVSE